MSDQDKPKEAAQVKKPGKMNIKINDDAARGAYSNLSIIHNNEFEFIMDFIFMEPGRPQGQLVSRVVTNPRAAKRMLKGLTELVRLYEQRFGEIKVPDEAPVKSNYH